jgi:hypothetical protein
MVLHHHLGTSDWPWLPRIVLPAIRSTADVAAQPWSRRAYAPTAAARKNPNGVPLTAADANRQCTGKSDPRHRGETGRRRPCFKCPARTAPAAAGRVWETILRIDCWALTTRTRRRYWRHYATGPRHRDGRATEPRRLTAPGRFWVNVHPLVIDDAGNTAKQPSVAAGTSSRVFLHGGTSRTFGDEAAGLYAESQQQAVDRVAEAARLDIDCDLERVPAVADVESPDRLDEIRAEADATAGVAASFVTESGLPFPIAGAFRVENQAQFHPRPDLLALAEDVTRTGSPNRRTVRQSVWASRWPDVAAWSCLRRWAGGSR